MARVYEYDVYISYERTSRTVLPWIRNHFYPRLSELLNDSVHYDVKIFFDESLPVGTELPTTVRTALRCARILLPVCSPKYFYDEWCTAEWQSMAKREEIARMVSPDQPYGLIYPVIFSDSENFPDWAKRRQMRSCKMWNLHYPQFEATRAYLGFHREVARIAEDLVRLIERAPEWRPDWPVLTPVPERPARPGLPKF